MSPKATNATKTTTPTTNTQNPNPEAPLTLRPSQLAIVQDGPQVTGPATNETPTLTPEGVLTRIETELQALATKQHTSVTWVKGPKAWNLKTAGQRIANALAEVRAAEEHAKQLRDEMTGLINEGIAAINGQTPPSKKKTPTPANGSQG